MLEMIYNCSNTFNMYTIKTLLECVEFLSGIIYKIIEFNIEFVENNQALEIEQSTKQLLLRELLQVNIYFVLIIKDIIIICK